VRRVGILRLTPAFTDVPRSLPVDSTSVMLPAAGSGRMPSANGAFTFLPRRRFVPVECMTLTFAARMRESCSPTPTFTIVRRGMSRPRASAYLLGGRNSVAAPPLYGSGYPGFRTTRSCCRVPSTRSVCSNVSASSQS
jgi:hypothetical protein